MPGAIVVALAVGSAIAIQVAVVGRASRTLHPLLISLALQMAGLLVGIGWLFWSRTWSQLPQVIGQWWWLPLGIVGWVVVAALGFSAARLGASTTLAIVIGSQLVAGLLLDRAAGQLDLGAPQVLGAALLVAGAVLVSWR
jgi:bacterial/archaeal transporter family-2 protein